MSDSRHHSGRDKRTWWGYVFLHEQRQWKFLFHVIITSDEFALEEEKTYRGYWGFVGPSWVAEQTCIPRIHTTVHIFTLYPTLSLDGITNNISRWRDFVCTYFLWIVLIRTYDDCSWNWNKCSRICINFSDLQWKKIRPQFPMSSLRCRTDILSFGLEFNARI